MIKKAFLWIFGAVGFFGQTYLQILKLVQSIKAANDNDIAFWGSALMLNLAVFVWFAVWLLKSEKQ